MRQQDVCTRAYVRKDFGRRLGRFSISAGGRLRRASFAGFLPAIRISISFWVGAAAREGQDRALLHIEMLTASDPDMTLRMLKKLLAIRYWAIRKPGLEEVWPSQTVLHVGSERWGLKTEMRDEQMQHVRAAHLVDHVGLSLRNKCTA